MHHTAVGHSPLQDAASRAADACRQAPLSARGVGKWWCLPHHWVLGDQALQPCPEVALAVVHPPQGVVDVVEAVLATSNALGAHSELVAAAVVGGEGEGDADGLALGVGSWNGRAGPRGW